MVTVLYIIAGILLLVFIALIAFALRKGGDDSW